MKKILIIFLAFFCLASSSSAEQPKRFIDVIIVLNRDFAPGSHSSNKSQAGEFARDMGLTARFTYGTALFGFAARIPEARLQAMKNHPLVKYVDFDQPVTVPFVNASESQKCIKNPDNPGCGGNDDGSTGGGSGGSGSTTGEGEAPWGVVRIGASSIANTGEGVHVYVIDSGIDSNHRDLNGNIGNGYAVVSCNHIERKTCKQDWDDDYGHGTHVAGTIAALANDSDVVGVAPGATLHAVKVLTKYGKSSFAKLISGVDYVAAQTDELGVATVANMSLQASGFKDGVCTSSGYSKGSDSLYEAICSAKNKGVIFAVAAGNSKADAHNTVPGAYEDAVITASATDASDDWWEFSNYGDPLPIALAAPGADVLSTKMGGGTELKSGTSMAAPHVAGALALYLAIEPTFGDGTAFTNARSRLLNDAEDTSSFSNSSGNPHAEKFLNVINLN